MPVLWFTLNNLLAVTVALLVTDMAYTGRGSCRKSLAAAALFPVVVFVATLLAGATGRLTSPALAGILAAMAAAAGFLARRSQGKSTSETAGASGNRFAGEPKFRQTAMLSLLTFAVALAVGGYVLPGTAFGWDDFSYHASIPAHWLIDQRLSLPATTPAAHYPLNAETLSLWFMLPFHSDAYAGLAGIYWLGLIVFAVIAAGVLLRQSLTTTVVVAALVFCSPVVTTAARTFSAVDVAGPAMLVVAMVMVGACSRRSATEFRADVLFAGLFCGYALGSKIVFVPACLLLLCWILVGPAPAGASTRRLPAAALFVAAACVTGSFWYLRNAVITGNPLFPAQTMLWDGPWTSDYLSRTKLMTWISESPADRDLWRFLLRGYIDWPVQYFAACASGYVGALSVIRGTRGAAENGKAFAMLLLLAGLILAGSYPFMPFSGTNAGSLTTLKVELRFLVAPFLIGLLLLAHCIDSSARNGWWLAGVVFVALLPLDIGVGKYGANVAVLGLAGLVILICRHVDMTRLSPVLTRTSLIAVCIAVSLALALVEPVQRQRTGLQVTRSDKSGQAGKAWEFLETLPDGSVIAQIGYKDYQVYPLFGRDLQHRPVAIDEHGSLLRPLYSTWREGVETTPFAGGPADAAAFDGESFVENLLESRVRFVLLRKYPGQTEWYRKRVALRSSASAQRVYVDSSNEVYELVGVAGGD